MDKVFGDETRSDVIFKTVFRGYDKQDVNDYIVSLVRSNQSDAERYSSHIRGLEEERTENAKKILELTKRNKVLTGLVQAEAEARLELEKESAEYKAQRDNADEDLKRLKEQLLEIRGEMVNILSVPEALEADHMREVTALTAEIEDLKLKLEASNSEIEMLKAKIEELTSKSDEKESTGGNVDCGAASSDYTEVRKSLERLENILKGLDD